MDSRSCYVSSFYSLNGCFQQPMVTSHANQDLSVDHPELDADK